MTASILLASSSPRRAQLLRQLDLKFDVYSSNIDESEYPHEQPVDYVLRMAREKALVAKQTVDSDVKIIAADTIVTIDGRILGKPETEDRAKQMWHLLSNNWHNVHTAVALVNRDNLTVTLQSNEVLFKALSEPMMVAYWQTGEPIDKAGGYAIQGLAAGWIKRIKGSYSGIMGLPLYETSELLKEAGVNLKL